MIARLWRSRVLFHFFSIKMQMTKTLLPSLNGSFLRAPEAFGTTSAVPAFFSGVNPRLSFSFVVSSNVRPSLASSVYVFVKRIYYWYLTLISVKCQNKSIMRWTRYHMLKYTKQNLKGCVGWLIIIAAKTLWKTSKISKCWEECIYKKSSLSLPFFKF